MGNEINYNALINEITKCCFTENACGSCNREICLVGYCKKSLITALKENTQFIDGGMEGIPYTDTKVYEEEDLIETIGFILNQCRNCQLYHDEDCVINIIRSSMEVGLLGESQEYGGSSLVYLSDMHKVNPDIADRLLVAFKNKKGGN
ncbi:hypothetical protein [Alkaliphilus transvaalensis]|uniref:hypothetical protein n=1 Tax=Alkaliphilus transvaalensis TaxID=114628 RepID=UPI00047B4477|nr:hypothetical protein [Alkaliphilus transvaalensis]